MKKMVKRLALVLVLALMLTSLGGCDLLFMLINMSSQSGEMPELGPVEPVITEPVITEPAPEQLKVEFTLTEEDIQRIDAMIDSCKELSYSTTATREEVEKAWDDLDEQLNFVSDQVTFAMVIYYMDTSDESANQTYLDAYDDYLALADKGTLVQKDMYEDSPVKDWFFEDWTEEDIAYLISYTSEQVEIQAELEENNTEFVELEEDDVVEKYTDMYIQMVSLGNRQAELCGYDNYYDYMAANAYGRDYTAEDREKFQNYIKTVIIPAYGDIFNSVMAKASTLDYQGYVFFMDYIQEDFDSLSRNYLQEYIDSTSGSTYESFSGLFTGGNFIATDNPNAREGAFCTYLDYYDQGLCFFGPGYQSTSTVVHEMGHYYANAYTLDGAPYDLLETHSQGNEMMLLAHMGQNPPAGYDFVRDYYLFNTLATVIIACMVDDYESRIYAMEDISKLTEEDVTTMISQICEEYFGAYGGEAYVGETLTDIQWYIRYVSGLQPAYYISYATSAVTAMNLFALAEEDYPAAQELYRRLVEEAPGVEGYEAALESIGAASPFDEESFKTIVELFQD